MDTFIELNCDLCHSKLTPYGSKVLKDGIICRNCAEELSKWLTDKQLKQLSLQDIENHLQYRTKNLEHIKNFKFDKVVKGRYSLYIDSENREFVISKAMDLVADNSDVIRADSIESIQIQKVNNENNCCDIFVNINLINSEITSLSFKVNQFSTIEFNSDIYNDTINQAILLVDTIINSFQLDVDYTKYKINTQGGK